MSSPAAIAVIGIASNCHPRTNVQAAVKALQGLLPGLRHSRMLTTPPLQHTGPDYVNAIATAGTTLPPQALVCALKQLERNQGRLPIKGGDVTLDLDLLAYGDLVAPELRLPRRELVTRDFNRILAEELGCLPPDMVREDMGNHGQAGPAADA